MRWLLLFVLLVPASVLAQGEEEKFEALLTQAAKELHAKKYDAAIATYGKAAKMRGTSAKPLVGVARAIFERGRATGDPRAIPQAKVILREARTRDGEWGGTWYFWGELSLSTRDHANAVNGFRGAMIKGYRRQDAKPLLAMALLWLGADQVRVGRPPFRKAIASLSESRKMFETLVVDEEYPEPARAEFERRRRQAMLNLAAVHQRANDLVAAEEVMRALVAAEPGSRDYHLSLGLILAAAGKSDAAMSAYARAVKLNGDPGWVEAYRPMGNHASRAGRYEEAEEYLRKYVAGQPESLEGWRTLGDHYLRQAKHAEAVKAFFRCLELDSGHVRAMGGLVTALTAAGRDAEAKKWSEVLARIRSEKTRR